MKWLTGQKNKYHLTYPTVTKKLNITDTVDELLKLVRVVSQKPLSFRNKEKYLPFQTFFLSSYLLFCLTHTPSCSFFSSLLFFFLFWCGWEKQFYFCLTFRCHHVASDSNDSKLVSPYNLLYQLECFPG